MGLDMYLYKKTYVGNEWKKPEEQVRIVPSGGCGVAIKQDRVSEISERVAYWRKANSIHKWFVDNVQKGVDDCGTYFVERKKLQDLISLCKTVLATAVMVDGKIKNGKRYENGEWVPILVKGESVQDATTAQILLPTKSGFFFGSTDYDEYYVEDLKNTVEQIDAVLNEEEGDFYYHSSW